MFNKSDRVLNLTAACIRTAVRLRYSRVLPFDDAIDLARRYDLHSALDAIHSKFQVHESLPPSIRFQTAVTEAKLSDLVNGREATDKIVEVRRVAIHSSVASTEGPRQREAFIAALLAIRRDATLWANEYEVFVKRLSEIYKDAANRLRELSLDSTELKEALEQLDEIVNVASERASHL